MTKNITECYLVSILFLNRAAVPVYFRLCCVVDFLVNSDIILCEGLEVWQQMWLPCMGAGTRVHRSSDLSCKLFA